MMLNESINHTTMRKLNAQMHKNWDIESETVLCDFENVTVKDTAKRFPCFEFFILVSPVFITSSPEKGYADSINRRPRQPDTDHVDVFYLP